MALPTASDNPFPSILITEGTEPAAPAAGKQRVYIDSTTHHLSRTDSSGVEVDLESTSGSLTTPTVVAVGTSATGTGAIVPILPVGHTTNDILLLFVQSDNQAATAPAGYTQLGPQVGIGTAAAAAATRLAVFWKRDGGSEVDPTVADTGDHTLAQMLAIRGCPTTGNPFENIGSARKTTASTTGTATAGATTSDKCLVVNAFAHALDSASAVFSAPTNADLTSVTEQIDVATADGNGGGIGVFTGIKAALGTFAATTVTETSTVDVSTTFVMLPVGAYPKYDRQMFITPGYADAWAKPSGAKTVVATGIGGGGSGSAGRNAATAAGGGGGGGAAFYQIRVEANELPATLVPTAGTGGAATANTDGTIGNNGVASQITAGGVIIFFAAAGSAAQVSATGSGGTGGNAGGRAAAASGAGVTTYDVQQPGGGTGGTTALAGGIAFGTAGGSGAGGGTTQASSMGGAAEFGGGGGGGGRSNTNVGTGGPSVLGQVLGGATAGANGADSSYPSQYGGSGAAGGTSAAGPGGTGGWPGGGGGGGGSQSGAQRGGAGGDGIVTIITIS